MPTAREALLSAARQALTGQPWATVRMVEVAAAAKVSRQTLYNEFGSKEGLGAALVVRQVEDFVAGAAASATAARDGGGGPGVCCAAAARWVLCRAREEPLVRAALTGTWNTRLPTPPPGRPPRYVLDRLCAQVGAAVPGGESVQVRRACEVGLRLALSYALAPPGEDDIPARLVHVVEALLAARPGTG
ncbi:TetR/AcrR family transcriptional regulator [Streptomyces sp. JJ66]|uniref:TetR/AcrR family transcriptional regulator n=1 Tax=Streptomyces sp. JJ66 TaxID=2803843 RepID=UPI001C5A1CCA|nr:TetR/AcrR family transcriptional regulator [Streptomyces sp. JJ66]MBW1603010.1 TetR/AcrR family transcriptional regulator [Streptomyces sp. JJ66]